MKTACGLWISSVLGSAAIVLAASQAAIAATEVTSVQVTPTSAGVNILLKTSGEGRPQVFSVSRGNSWTADLVDTKLSLPNGGYRQENPTEGIALVTVTPLDANSVRVTVTGQAVAPTGAIARSTDGNLMLSLNRSAEPVAKASPVTQPEAAAPQREAATAARPTQSNKADKAVPVAVPPPVQSASPRVTALTRLPAASATTVPSPVSGRSSATDSKRPVTVAQAEQPPVPTQAQSPVPTVVTPQVAPPRPGAQGISPVPVFRDYTPLVPNPDVRVEGGVALPANAPLPLPRAIAPPVGDIATGQFIPSPSNTVDLGTAERVPRLVLRDAPAREVLSLLAKAAGLNIVFVGGTGTPQPGQAAPAPGQAADSEGPRVTLDIENELVQNAFNYVLQVTGLEANRIGNTIFVGTRLPNSARNLVVRSLRLNQVPVANALNFLVGLGAESAITRERLVTSVNAIPIQAIGTGGTAPAITQTQTTTEQRVEVQRVAFLDSTPLLRGLQVSGDERTNTMTIIGPARLVDTAISQLLQLDVRRRQVTVNVRVIDVNLNALDQFGTSFSFGIDNSQFLVGAGAALINLGRNAPGSVSIPTTPGNPINPGNGFPTTGFSNSFLLQLQAAIDTQNAKIITDPTLVVQEGQTATVNLTQEVVTNLSQQVTATGDTATVTITAERTPAGLTLPVRIDRIDDNGFISLSVAPSITRPAEEFTLELPGTGGSPGTSGQIVLLSRREVQSGQVRLRDGQTLVLAGIIEEEDRTTVRKVPILGDIPLLGALFRSTSRENLRREVIVLLTPRILDDSQNSGFGYGYTPSPAARELLEREEQRRR